MFIITAIRQGQNPDLTFERIRFLFSVWRSTVNRWKQYFRELFPQSIEYRRLAGHMIPPIYHTDLPGALLERFGSAASEPPETALVNCLRVLALGP